MIMKFGLCGKDYNIFGLDDRTFNRRWIIYISKGDNNYSISMIIFLL